MKFWFIKNYMSPQMKRFLPLMAEHYGFEYEFVTYKWPTWLHKQVRPAHTCSSCKSRCFAECQKRYLARPSLYLHSCAGQCH